MRSDHLAVFVSSTIGECAAKRGVARKAILSINHQPVLFEDLGARPYPPRDLYKPRLEASHFFVGIYRESYGWVAPDMAISGIEDEFRIASDCGMDRLIYILKPAPNRDPRLDELLDGAKGGLTVGFYSLPDELFDRIRDDLTSIISERFAGQAAAEPAQARLEDILNVLVGEPHLYVRRRSTEASLVEQFERMHRLQVIGPLGSGKSVLLAQLALENEWFYIDARGLTPLETVARAVNRLRAHVNRSVGTYSSLSVAWSALAEAWSYCAKATLLIDGVEDGGSVWDLLSKLELSDTRRVIICPRAGFATAPDYTFTVPKWSHEEISALSTAARGSSPSRAELSELARVSDGNPLYLRFQIQAADPLASASLKELELHAVTVLDAPGREIVSYIALAGRPLSLLDVQGLLGRDETSIHGLVDIVARNGSVLRQIQGNIDLVHDHLRSTVVEQLAATPARLSFLASRLVDYLMHAEDFLSAFMVLRISGIDTPSDGLTERASHQIALRGGGTLAVPVLDFRLAQARLWDKRERELSSLLALAQVFQQIGDATRSAAALQEARELASESHDGELVLRVRETQLDLQLASGGANPGLAALRDRYLQMGRPFDAARVAISMAVDYIEGAEYRKAAQVLREALAVFKEFGDEYGMRIARLNLAAALSGVPGEEDEALVLAQELAESIDPGAQPRERAMICNLLTRRYRQMDQPAEAEKFALEAISIGESLTDRRIIAMNRINLGNTLRDRLRLAEAEDQYKLADGVANSAGLPRIEAFANALVSSVLNQRGEFGLAQIHAQHSAALARVAKDFATEARAHEEHAAALLGSGRVEEAIGSYTESAIAMSNIGFDESMFITSLAAALLNAAREERPDLAVESLLAAFGDNSEGGPLKALCDSMPHVARLLAPAYLIPLTTAAFSTVLGAVPLAIERQAVRRVLAALANDSTLTSDQLLAAIVGVLLACDWRSLVISDTVEIAERLTTVVPGLYFKPHSDGAAHWTIRLNLGSGVICTISQIDDSAWISSITLLLALLFRVLAAPIRDIVIASAQPARTEFQLNVISHEYFRETVTDELSGIGPSLDNKFAISRPTDIAALAQPPIIMICGEELCERWRPESVPVSDMHLLFGDLLEVVVSHLFAGEVEHELLRPKLATVLRTIAAPRV